MKSRTPQSPRRPCRRTLRVVHRLAFCVALLALGAAAVAADELGDQVRAGVELHDAGDYQGAIQAFRQVLQQDPSRVDAHYELANSYFYSGDYASCAATARKALKPPTSPLSAGLHMLAGSCLSSAGKPRKALRHFRDGLKLSPADLMLNFNIGVTLASQGESDEAVGHFATAIDADPTYASPYLMLGELHRLAGSRLQSLFYFARFVTLEPRSQRAGVASAHVFGHLSAGITPKGGGDMEVMLSVGDEEDPWSPLEFSLSLAGMSMHVPYEPEESGEAAPPPTDAARHVEALVSFFQMALEMTASDADTSLTKSPAWIQAAQPILRLHQAGHSKALAYVMAANVGMPGAEEWLQAHPDAVATVGPKAAPGGR